MHKCPYTAYAICLEPRQDQSHTQVSQEMFKQLNRSAKQHGWTVIRSPAVDGSQLPNTFWDSHPRLRVSDTIGKFLNKKGAWGCMLSHYNLWHMCRSQNKPIIVLEHDAVIQAPWQDLDLEPAVIKLHLPTKTKHKGNVGRWSTGTWAYTLTPEQADQLITGTERVGVMSVDKLIGSNLTPWRFLDHDLVIHNPEPHVSTVSRRY